MRGWGRTLALVVAGVVGTSGLAMAAGHEVETSAELTSEASASADEGALGNWEIAVAPYLWITGVQGNVTIDGTSVDVDSTVGDTFDLLGSLEAGGFMTHIDVRNDRLGFFVDFAFMGINTTEAIGPRALGSLRAKILEYFVEYGATWRVLEMPTKDSSDQPLFVELLAGARWNRISSELAFSRLPNDIKSKIEFMDPIVGGRFNVPFYRSETAGGFGVWFRGDIGGFGAGSDLSWNLIGALRWDMPWKLLGGDLGLLAGYKTYYFRDQQVSDGVDSSIALQTGGPIVGLGLLF